MEEIVLDMEQRSFLKRMTVCSAIFWVVILMISVMGVMLVSAEVTLAVVLGLLAVFSVVGSVYYSKARRKINKELMQSVAVDDLTGLPTKQQHKIEATQIIEENKGK